jgi:hypothetical protein
MAIMPLSTRVKKRFCSSGTVAHGDGAGDVGGAGDILTA